MDYCMNGRQLPSIHPILDIDICYISVCVFTKINDCPNKTSKGYDLMSYMAPNQNVNVRYFIESLKHF